VIYFCCDDKRRAAVKESNIINGIDFLEVSDDQRTLFVHFLKPLADGELDATNIRIEGGERIRDVLVVSATIQPAVSPPEDGSVLAVVVKKAGDFSLYTLRLVRALTSPPGGDASATQPPDGFDPILSAIDFSFKVACQSGFDCAADQPCPAPLPGQPDFNYLAKDYASLRQFMLDRMALLAPGWTERSPADLGLALVETIAYVADYLSYQQDATGTEAYLSTARRRVSIKRHARLIDYFLNEGSTARVWVQAVVAEGIPPFTLAASNGIFRTQLLSAVRDVPKFFRRNSAEYDRAIAAQPEIFEMVESVPLLFQHNRMAFYTWGSEACCLPKGATRATLRGAFPNLLRGTVLIFAEERGPLTGDPDDADPTRGHAVRLSADAVVTEDPIGGRFDNPPNNNPVDVTEIQWSGEDALPFPICISARQGSSFFDNVSVAYGNILLADFGATEVDEALPDVPSANPVLDRVPPSASDRCHAQPPQRPAGARYRPALKKGPVTHAADYALGDPDTSASAVMKWPDKTPAPVITLREFNGNGDSWGALPDLLEPNAGKSFVLEAESDGTSYLRFGDGQFGDRPPAGLQLAATYRVGNGAAGNIGRNTLVHLVSNQAEVAAGAVEHIWNPMPAQGGVDPESVEHVRQNAPAAFRAVQERAVTPDDYGEKARECRSDIQRASATFRWTGSWRTVFVAVDRIGGLEVDRQFRDKLQQCLERFRMAGHDLEVADPVFVPLEVHMTVCIDTSYFNLDVYRALLDIFNNRTSIAGQKGLFHPDKFSFGQPVYLSPFYAAAQNVEGVKRVRITTFERYNVAGSSGIDAGKLTFSPVEIARLDNDPNFPERGVFNLTVQGGR
jgi:hypothetical protein